MSIKKQVASSVKWTFLATVVTSLFQLIQLFVLARFLIPDDFGLMGMIMVVIGIAQACSDLGISASIIQRQHLSPTQLSSLYWVNLLAGGAVFLVLLISAPCVAWFFGDPRLLRPYHTLSLIPLISAAGRQFELLLQKELRFLELARQDILSGLIALVVATACANSGLGVWALVNGVIVQQGVKNFLLVAVGLRDHRPLPMLVWKDLGGFISFGLFQMGERLLNLLAERLDQILIGSLLGASSLGFYNFAFNLVGQPLSRINPVVTRVSFPVFSIVQDHPERLRNGYLKAIGFLMAINAPLLIGFAAVAPVAVPLLFGPAWVPAVGLIQILSLVALSKCAANPVGALLLAKGRADLGFKWNLILFFLSIPMIYAGAHWGTSGIAFALLVLQVCLHIPGYTWLIRPFIGDCGLTYIVSILKPTLLAVAMGIIAFQFLSLTSVHGAAFALFSSVLIGTVIYGFFMWLFEKQFVIDIRSMLLNN